MRRRFIGCGCIGLAVLLGMICLLFVPSTSNRPYPPPPKEAKNVYFYEYHAWQSWDYEYRFDAPPEVCQTFATELMKQQSIHRDKPHIVTNEFTRFPVGSRFQPWFDVSTIKNGLLISGDDWIYAVIDRDRGRLYYFNSY